MEIIKHHDHLYYIQAEPIICDATYDAIVREYRKFDPEFKDFQPGLNVPVPKKKKLSKRVMRPTRKKPPIPNGQYRTPGDNWREYVVFDSDDWTVHYWDVYFSADGPRYFKAETSRVGWEQDLEEGKLAWYDN